MFMRFFTELRQAKVPVTLKEYLMLMEGLDKHVIGRSVESSIRTRPSVISSLSASKISTSLPSTAGTEPSPRSLLYLRA